MVDSRSLPAEDFSTSVLDALMEGFQVLDFDLRYLYLNEAAAVHGRATRVSLLGRTMLECYPGIEHSELYKSLRRCLTQRTSHTFENEFQYADGTSAYFELRIEPVPQGVSVLSIDFNPSLKVICTASYAVPELAQPQALPEQVVVLEKPYAPSLLVKTVAAVCAADDTVRL